MAEQPVRRRAASRSTALVALRNPEEICLEAPDHSVVRRSAVQFFQLRNSRDPQSQAARLAEQFVAQNRVPLSLLDVTMSRDYDGKDVFLSVTTGGSVGAVPLLSPTSARPDYGLVVQPRFPWGGIGPMLAEMGWRIVPAPLRLPLLKRSERRVPAWVISCMVFARLQALLARLDRRFELVQETCAAPRGSVQWEQYATRQVPHARLLDVPCRYPDLRDDREMKGAIRFTLERQMRSLETQREQGAFVHRLILVGEQLLSKVRAVPPYAPPAPVMERWLHRPLYGTAWLDGLQAIEWTLEERGLAGVSDLEGIPWAMSMNQFFEAWVETLLRAVATRVGGRLKVGRNRETTAPLIWEPPYLGSQKSLAPDLWLEWETCTLIVDAKYKRHWEELQQGTWSSASETLREQHRHDLLQVLAYANLASTGHVVACLAYPCSQSTWESLLGRGRLFHKADLQVRDKVLRVWLTAVPMDAVVDRVATPLIRELQALHRELGS
jgi:hypothetical protein